PPGAELWNDRSRSGIGRFGRRPDIAALVLVLVFGAFANAAGMVGPVAEWQERLAGMGGVCSPLVGTRAFFLVGILVLPPVGGGYVRFALPCGADERVWPVRHRRAAAFGSRQRARAEPLVEVATRYAYALVPIGFGMWLAHYCFHFLTSYDTAVPVAQRFAADLGLTWLGNPPWGGACLRPRAEWLPPLGRLFFGAGLARSLLAGS